MSKGEASTFSDQLRRAVLADGADLTDGQLLEQFVAGREEAALAVLIRRHAPMVWGVCSRTLRQPQDAEDAFQATFLVLVRRAAAVVPRERVGNWLYGVALQTARKARAMAARRSNREKQVTALPEPAAAEHAQPDDLGPVLDEALARLPDPYRAVVVLCDLEGRTRTEAARELGLPEGTVASRLARAREMLANRLARHGLVVIGVAVCLPVAAGVPPTLLAAAVRAATLTAAGRAGTTSAISTTTIVLTEGVLRTMWLTKLARMTAAVLLAVVACTGGALAVVQLRAADAPGDPPGQEKKEIPPKEAVPQKGEQPGDAKQLAGKWKLSAFGMDGVRLTGKEMTDHLARQDGFPAEWTFTGENLEWPAPKPDMPKVRIPYRLDEKANPKRIDVGTFGLGKDVKYPFTTLGVYKLADDTLMVCWAPNGQPRPDDFKTKPKDGRVLLEFDRVQEKKK